MFKRIFKFFHDLVWDENHQLRKWFVFNTALLIPIWGLLLTCQGNDNSDNLDVLNKILISTDSTYNAMKGLKELPKTFSDLNSILKNLSEEGKRLSGTYNSADSINQVLIQQQKMYVEKLIKLTESTNTTMSEVANAHKSLNKEYNRKPKIKFSCTVKERKGRYYVQAVNILNDSDIECNIESLLLVFYPPYVCPDSLYTPMEYFYPEIDKNVYRLNMEMNFKKTIGGGRTNVVKTSHSCYFPSKTIIVGYNFAYHSNHIDTTIIGKINDIIWQ